MAEASIVLAGQGFASVRSGGALGALSGQVMVGSEWTLSVVGGAWLHVGCVTRRSSSRLLVAGSLHQERASSLGDGRRASRTTSRLPWIPMPCAGELSSPASSGGLLGDVARRHAPRQGRRDRIVCCVLVPPQPRAGEAETLRAAGELAELVPLNSSDLGATAGCPTESFGWRARKCSSRARIGRR